MTFKQPPFFETMTDDQIKGFIQGFKQGSEFVQDSIRLGAVEFQKFPDYREGDQMSPSYNLAKNLKEVAEVSQLVADAMIELFERWERPKTS